MDRKPCAEGNAVEEDGAKEVSGGGKGRGREEMGPRGTSECNHERGCGGKRGGWDVGTR